MKKDQQNENEQLSQTEVYAQLVHGSLFSGIGGFDLAADWMGWENAFHCELDAFGKKILKYYWPNTTSYEDITKTDFSIWRGRIDVLSGGFPCQPYSVAGKRKGKEDERHLWPEMLRAIREIQPQWVVGENVLGITNWNGGLVFDEVQADLEAQGYEVQPYVLPACAVNAPHRRDRVWFVAYKDTNKDGRGSFQRKEKTEKWRQRDVSSGDNERIRTNNGQVGIATDPSSFGYRGRNIESGTDKTEKRALDKNIQQYGDGVRSEAEGCSEFATAKYFTNSECKRLQGCKRKGSAIEEKEQHGQSTNYDIKHDVTNSECGRGRSTARRTTRKAKWASH